MGRNVVKTKVDDDMLVISCPYNSAFIKAIKRIGGKWERPNWVVDIRQKDRAEEILRTYFSEDGTGEPVDTVDIRLTGLEWDDCTRSNEIGFCGRIVAYREFCDSGVTFGDKVVAVNADFSDSTGSRKRPVIRIDADTCEFEVYDVARSVYEKIKDIPGVELLPAAGSKELRITKLKADRERLVAHIAEIDAELAKLEQIQD